MQIFLTTINPGTYTFPDLGDYTIVHPIGPIPLLEPIGEFLEEDIQFSEDLLAQVTAGNISLTNEGGDNINDINDLQTGDPGIYVRNTGDEDVAGVKSFIDGLNVIGTTDYETTITDDDDIPNKKYVDDLIVSSDLSALRLRRTTSLNPIPTAWADFDWNQIDEQNNTSVLEYTGIPTDDIDIKDPGLYLISWAISADDEVDVRLVNNSTVVPGSFHTVGDKTDSNQNLHANAKTIAATLTTGNLTLQVQAVTTAEFTIAESATITVVRLTGAAGPPGVDGPEGLPGFGIYAWATVAANATITTGLGLSVVSAGTGFYNYTFDNAVLNDAYAVFTQAVGQGLNDIEAEVFNKTLTGFSVRVNTQDDGGGTGSNTNSQHSVVVIGPNNGLPSGTFNTIDVPPLTDPIRSIEFDQNDFTTTFVAPSTATIGAIDKSIFSIIRIESTGADQGTNYNSTNLQPLVLTGNVTQLGTALIDFTNVNGTTTCNFDGVVRVRYAVPHFTTGARESLKTTIQLNNNDYSAAAYGYIRDSQGHRRDCNVGEDIIPVLNGDTIRVGIVRAENSTAGGAVTLEVRTTIIIERIA